MHIQQTNTKRLSNVVLLLADVEDGGPTLKQHWLIVSCLLGNFVFLIFLRYISFWNCIKMDKLTSSVDNL